MGLKKKILIVDDDAMICESVAETLSSTFEVFTAQNVNDAHKLTEQNTPDALLLDVHLGLDNGMQFCERLRQNPLTQKIQIFLITGFGSKEKLIDSYKVGADDYIEKPFDIEELKIRLLGRLKRLEDIAGKVDSVGNLKVYFDRNEIELDGKIKQLSQIEVSLLKIFLSNLNKKVSRESILTTIWSGVKVEERTVDVHISGLRKKLKEFNYQIDSLYGSGYILRPHKDGS